MGKPDSSRASRGQLWLRALPAGVQRPGWGRSLEARVRGQGPGVQVPTWTLDLSLFWPHLPSGWPQGGSLPRASVAHALLALRACDLALLSLLSGPLFPCQSDTAKAFPARTCCDCAWRPPFPSNLPPLKEALGPSSFSRCPVQGWRRSALIGHFSTKKARADSSPGV